MKKKPLLPALASVSKPVFGMCHLPPLAGAPRYGGDRKTVLDFLLHDAETLVAGGVHGLMIENFGDTPFYPGRVPAHVVAQMTALAHEVRKRFTVPLGINVLRNDASAALGIAHAVGADFIRINILSGARVTDQGVIQSAAHELLRERMLLRAENIHIWADVNVKESMPLGAPFPIEDEVADTIERGGADAIIVSGGSTGQSAQLEELKRAQAAAGATPALVGSGIRPETIQTYLPYADGFIVGTALKKDGHCANPVDGQRVRALLERLK